MADICLQLDLVSGREAREGHSRRRQRAHYSPPAPRSFCFQKGSVFPHIVASSVVRQEAPPRRQAKKPLYARTPLLHVANVQRLEKIRVVRRLTARPYVPPGGIAF